MTTQLQRGNRLLASKQYEAARQAFLAHASEVPAEAPRALAQAAECVCRSNIIREPVDLQPGVTLVAQGDSRGAEVLYRQALAIEPSYFPALRGLALILPAKSEEQIAALEAAVSVRTDLLLVQMLADCYEDRGSVEEARALCARALHDHPKARDVRARLQRLDGSGGPTTE
jgi:tetratricopeptide (TPR) repeat protein